jgi:hypothetical protein
MSGVVALVCTVLSCVTALVVGHLHRKQLRQLEAFRADPNSGLMPSDSALLRFFKDHWYYLFWLPPLYLFIRETTSSRPITRAAVFSMVVNGAVLTFLLALEASARLILLVVRRLLGTSERS